MSKVKMTPSEALVETLVAEGVNTVFGIVGSAFYGCTGPVSHGGDQVCVGGPLTGCSARRGRSGQGYGSPPGLYRTERSRGGQFCKRHHGRLLGP